MVVLIKLPVNQGQSYQRYHHRLDMIVEHQMDIFAFTETWMSGDESDDFILSTIAVPGYDIYNVPRGGGDAHGGVAVLFKSCLTVMS